MNSLLLCEIIEAVPAVVRILNARNVEVTLLVRARQFGMNVLSEALPLVGSGKTFFKSVFFAAK